MGEPTTKRVMFVDDEESVLSLLLAMFRRLGPEWEVVGALSGAEALKLMAEQPVDVVVTDMRMPGMSGAELLYQVAEKSPRTARVILSGYADQEMVLRSLGATHQFLSKPCEVAELRSAIARILALDKFLGSDTMKVMVARVRSLPSLPSLYFKLMRELALPTASTESIGAIISQDISLSAKLLQLVNSAFFGVASPVSSVEEAVQILGVSTVKALALSIYVFSVFESQRHGDFPMEELWKHSLGTGFRARRIAMRQKADPGVVDAAFTGGVLHDVGKLVIAFGTPGLYRKAVELSHARRIPAWQAERQVLWTSHAEVGGYLLGLWGLPAPIVEAVAWHHAPGDRQPREFCALTAVHIANALENGRASGAADLSPLLDRPYLEELDLMSQIREWAEEGAGS